MRNTAIDELMAQKGMSFGRIKFDGESLSKYRRPNSEQRAKHSTRSEIEAYHERRELNAQFEL
ncbi:hypothetical protein P7F88_25195 [Vibrio hannami]|uniref:hypothetical protein n=1 Tax=Vibrio hannami TaxID=2717094 RepID=UPI00240F3F8D|nr:hypothetical protein [Vibrio hannami]MDG3089161.1 hypothetical protein [Vibrio hannami]